jgi:hypothetical protein
MLREIKLMILSGVHLYRLLGDSPHIVVGFESFSVNFHVSYWSFYVNVKPLR